MKKLVLLLFAVLALFFVTNSVLACDCGCKKGQPCTCEKCDCKDCTCDKKCDCNCEGCKTGDCTKCDCKDCDCEKCNCKEKTVCPEETSAPCEEVTKPCEEPCEEASKPCEEKCEKSSCEESCKGKKSFFSFFKRHKGCPVEQK